IGVTTAEKEPTLLPHNNVKYLKKAGSGNLLRPDMPDTNAWRFSSSSPGGDLGSKTRTPTGTFNAQGQCKKGNNCTSPHGREGSGFCNLWSQEENAGSLTSVGYGKHR
uniref:C3H1-type domain-containing protein n=2 Tax=Aegilops tauschii TaxID=37682 RepID=A0A452ZFP6_AEGTS